MWAAITAIVGGLALAGALSALPDARTFAPGVNQLFALATPFLGNMIRTFPFLMQGLTILASIFIFTVLYLYIQFLTWLYSVGK